MLKNNDFFAGAGGMGLGFKYAGFELAGAWDFDKYAVESYKNNISDLIKQVDITQMSYNEIPFANVWTFGFPCVDISIAGKRKGMIKGETRSGLFFEIMRLLEETESNKPNNLPMIILAENVKAVKAELPAIEKEYEKREYKMYTTLYNSKYFNVPQNRERYFILGVHKSIDKEFVFKEQQTEFVPKLSSILDLEVDKKYYMSNDVANNIIEEVKLRAKIIDSEASFKKEDIKVIGRLDMKGHDIIRRVYDTDGISPTLTTSDGGHRQPKILTDDFKVRKLTPKEYARLQGFPDTYRLLVSNRQLYKQFGNAVTVNVAQFIAEQISDFLND